jgi:hypothetical protein
MSDNLLPIRTQQRHTHQITDQDDCRPGQSEKNDKEVKGERGVKLRRVQGGMGLVGWWVGKESRTPGNRQRARRRRREERRSSRGRKGVERRPRMRELVKEGVIGRVGLEGKGAAEDMSANCLKDSSGDFLDRLQNVIFSS